MNLPKASRGRKQSLLTAEKPVHVSLFQTVRRIQYHLHVLRIVDEHEQLRAEPSPARRRIRFGDIIDDGKLFFVGFTDEEMATSNQRVVDGSR